MRPLKPSAPPLSSQRLTAALVLAMLLASLGTSIANIALPALGTAFAAPFSAVQRVVVAYLVGLTVAVVYAGRLGDRFGLRPVLAAGLLLFAASSLLCSVASQLSLLVMARLLQGVGAAFMMTLSMALMRQTSTAERLGRSMGLMGSVSALGTALGPALGGLLLPLTGWRGLFWIPLPLAMVALLLLVALPGQAPAGRSAPPGLRQVLNRAMLNTLAVNLLVAAVMMTTLVVGPFYLSQGLQLTAGEAGLVMAAGPLIGMCCGVPAGRLVDRLGHRFTQRLGLTLMACGTLLLAATGAAGGVAGYLLAIVTLTPGYQLCQVANNSAVLAEVPDNQRGTVSGLLNLSRNLGLIAGASLLGALFAWASGTAGGLATAGAQPVVTGMRLTFLTVGVLLTLALLSTLRKTAGRQATQK